MADLFLTRQRMTHRASWIERSASSITSLLEPRTTMLTVFPGLVTPVTCNKKNARLDKAIQAHFDTRSKAYRYSFLSLTWNLL